MLQVIIKLVRAARVDIPHPVGLRSPTRLSEIASSFACPILPFQSPSLSLVLHRSAAPLPVRTVSNSHRPPHCTYAPADSGPCPLRRLENATECFSSSPSSLLRKAFPFFLPPHCIVPTVSRAQPVCVHDSAAREEHHRLERASPAA
jgi:hypothetical protein